MKKQYITPTTAAVVAIATDAVLTTASRGVISEEFDIDYGGIDEDGTQVPGARLHHSIWDDEEDEF